MAVRCNFDCSQEHLPCLLNGAFENIACGVDEDIKTAYFLVQVCDDRLELFEVVGDIQVCCDGAFILEVFQFGGVTSCGDDGVTSRECFEGNAFAKAAGGGGDEPDGGHCVSAGTVGKFGSERLINSSSVSADVSFAGL